MNTDTLNSNQSLATKNKKGRKNSIIDLLRFFFSMWVLYFHSYVPFENEYFSDGKLAVEFFFVLSGFFLVRSMKKYDSMPLGKGLGTFLRHRFKTLAVPFIIGDIFVLIHSFIYDFSYNFLFGYLWYIRDLFIAMAFFFLLKRLIKDNTCFYCVIALLSIFSIFYSGKIPGFSEWPGGAFRSLASMPIGMIAAALPQLPKKIGGKSCKKISALIAILGFIAAAVPTFGIVAAINKDSLMVYALVIICYPALLYFANQIRFDVGFLNWLGSLSFPIYSFQCILRVLEEMGLTNTTHLFIILMVLVVSFSFIMPAIEKQKANKKALTK